MEDSFTYLPLAATGSAWGLAVTSTGFVRTPPGSDYPSTALRHPADHLFTWERGRTLDCFQVLSVRRGAGWLETRDSGRRRIEEGAVFVLFPGVWHRYAPDRGTGWSEAWIEFEGEIPERLRADGVLSVRAPVFPLVAASDVSELMRSCHELARTQAPGFAGQLAAATLQILATLAASRDTNRQPTTHVQNVVRKAKRLFLERFEEPLRIRDVARELGIADSHLRRVFKASTGLSPKDYLLELRLRQVRILLRGSSLTLGEIAERTGYNSGYHLSAEFKKRTGTSPSVWRAERRSCAG